MEAEKNKSIGVIYKVTNKRTGEVYIGATTKTIQSREIDHNQKAKKGTGYKFQNAISTYGPEAFEYEQIDTAGSINELAEKEKKYIYNYDSKDNGYNGDNGGTLKRKIYKYDLEGQLVATFETLTDAANSVETTKQQISSTCLNVNNLYAGYYWSYSLNIPFTPGVDRRLKQVLQLDLNGKILRSFKSVAEASRKTGIYKGTIAKVCRFERNTAGGYIWKYNQKN